MNGLVLETMVVAMALVAVSLAQEGGAVVPRPRRGELVFATRFETPAEREKWPSEAWTRWTQLPEKGTCLEVNVPSTEAGEVHTIRLPLDVQRYGNCKLRFECRARAEGVTKPPHVYNGVKFMFHYRSPSQGPFWQNQNNVSGTFDWKKLGFTASVPGDVKEAWLFLGLQESKGQVWFDDLKVTVFAALPRRPKPDPNAGPAFRGHNLPRLRGVMSPNSFREEDLRVLGQEWNANLIRWQMTTRWAAAYKHPQDYDLKLYDRWLDAELRDLDQVLAACRKYGILVVVDLHSPPGGRRPNRDLVMLHEPVYLDRFVTVWEQIARRYKGNPAIWGYDLVNEPVQSEPPPEGQPDYLGAQVRAARAIRAIDPERPIIIEVDHWDSAEGFKYLEPVDVPRVVYQVHMYYPGQFTHQGVHGSTTGVSYPGKIGGRTYDKEALRQHLAPVREFQQAYSPHIYVGEFSAIRWAPNNSAYRYLRDCIDIFEEYGWDWSYHAYREWDGWSVEHGPDRKERRPTPQPTDRKRLLLGWFAKNEKPW